MYSTFYASTISMGFDFSVDPVTIQTSAISQMLWKDYLYNERRFNFVSPGNLPTYQNYTAEVFHRLFYDAEPHWIQPISVEHYWIRTLHERLSASDEFQYLTEICQGDPLASGMAAVRLAERMFKTLPQPSEKIQDLNELRKQAYAAKDEQERQDIIAMGKAIAAAATKLAEQIEEDGQALEAQIGVACEEAEEAIEEAYERMAALGLGCGSGSGDLQDMPADEAFRIAEKIRNDSILRQVLDMAGRFIQLTREVRRKAKEVQPSGELAGIETGDSLGRALPAELAKLVRPELKTLFYKDYLEQNLLQYQLKAPDNRGKGPMVLCVDVSGSMIGLPAIWAKAIALTFAELAREQKRELAVILFAEEVDGIYRFNQKTDLGQTLELMARHFNGGGTEFLPPLNKALEIIREDKALRKADVIFITDGECDIKKSARSRLAAQFKAQNTSLFSLILDGRSRELEELSDKCWQVEPSNQADELYIRELVGLL